MELLLESIEKPEAVNLILGQSHFIKTSGACLVRSTGTDEALVSLAVANAQRLAAGHAFLILLGEGAYPVNVLNAIKQVPEVCRIYCATANSVQVILAETEQGRGILGVVDGASPKGVEGPADVAWRHDLLRTIGYKL
jgi:adenosine/AMP kinase